MATIYGAIDGIKWLREPHSGGVRALAEVSFSVPAYTAGSDNGQLGGGGFLYGSATTDTLVTILQNSRRDGKTVTLRDGCSGEEGLSGTTSVFADTLAVATSNMTFECSNAAGTEINCTVDDKNCTVIVACDLS